MGLSFYEAWNAMEEFQDNTQEEQPAMNAVRSAMSLSDTFLDEFLNWIGDSDSVAALLDIPKHKITAWASRINDFKRQVEDADSTKDQPKKEMMPTGDGDPVAKPDDYRAMNMKPDPS